MTSWKYEAQRMGELTIPATCVYFGLFTPQALTAAFVGRKLGVQYLDGFSLANLMFVLGLSVLQGLVTANDTLMPQAFGAGNYKEVGFLAVRGFAVSLLVMVPICTLLYLYMHDVLLFIRQSPAPARLAEEFFRVYVWALPFNVLYVMQWKFLAAQQIVRPLVLVQLVACGAILPLALTCLVDWFGFVGGAWALVLYNAAQAVLLLAYIVLLRPHHPSTWPGMWIVRSAFSWEPVVAYLGLGVGGIFTSLEWWFWEILTLVVGTFGPIPLSVHTIASQVLINVEMISLGIANALVVRMGATIPQSASRAQKLMIWTYAAHTLMVVVELVLMWVFRYQIFSWFTKDPLTIELADDLWWKVLVYALLLTTYGMNVDAGSTALGLQWYAGFLNWLVLWVLTTPAILVFAVLYGGGLEAVWTCLIPPYAIMNALFFYRFVVFDWEDYSRQILQREECKITKDKPDTAATEGTPLV